MSPRRLKVRRRLLPLSCLVIAILLGYRVYREFVPNVAQLRQECQKAVAADEWNLVETVARRWTVVAPKSGEAWMQLGEALYKQRKFQHAVECYRSVPQSSPEAEAAAISQMEMLFGPLNAPVEAAMVCEQILTRNPQSKKARQRLLFFLALTLQRAELVHQVRSAIDSESEPIEAFVYLFMADTLMFSNGIELNSRWLHGDPTSEIFEVAQAIFVAQTLDFSLLLDDLAAAQAARRDAARRDAVMQKLIAKYPHNSELLAYNIQKLIQVGDVASVVKLLAEATVECEADPRFWRFKGWVHMQRNELSDAGASYRRAIELNPLDWVTRHMLSEVLQHDGHVDDVKTLRDITVQGRELHNALRNAPSAREVPRELLLQLADYAVTCGDDQVSRALRKRIQQDQVQ